VNRSMAPVIPLACRPFRFGIFFRFLETFFLYEEIEDSLVNGLSRSDANRAADAAS